MCPQPVGQSVLTGWFWSHITLSEEGKLIIVPLNLVEFTFFVLCLTLSSDMSWRNKMGFFSHENVDDFDEA